MLHVGDHEARHPDGGHQRVIDGLLPLLVGRVQQRAAPGSPDVIDEHIDIAEYLDRSAHKNHGAIVTADICDDSQYAFVSAGYLCQ